MSGWNLTNKIRNKFIPILKEYLDNVETATEEQIENMSQEEIEIDFSDTGISPSQLVGLLQELGYEETDRDANGWELDFWIYMKRKDEKHFDSGCEKLVVSGCGMTFELRVWIDDSDF